MVMNPKVRAALIQIDFVSRYEALSRRYNADRLPPGAELLEHLDREELLAIVRDEGFGAAFSRDGSRCNVAVERMGGYEFSLGIQVHSGMVDLVWNVEKGIDIILGMPWGGCAQRLFGRPEYKIKPPVITDYEELGDILHVALGVYRDFRYALLLQG